MYIYTNLKASELKLNISETIPKYLRVCDVEMCDKESYYLMHGTIEGDEEKVKELKEKLIHKPK